MSRDASMFGCCQLGVITVLLGKTRSWEIVVTIPCPNAFMPMTNISNHNDNLRKG